MVPRSYTIENVLNVEEFGDPQYHRIDEYLQFAWEQIYPDELFSDGEYTEENIRSRVTYPWTYRVSIWRDREQVTPGNRYYRPRCLWSWSNRDELNRVETQLDKALLEDDSSLGPDAATADFDKDPDETDRWLRCAVVTLGHRKCRRCRTSALVTMHRTNRVALQNLKHSRIDEVS